MLREFREFAVRGNVVDMAVGIIIGGAFGTIAKSLVTDVLMPPIGLLLGGVDFENLFTVLRQGSPPAPYDTLTAAGEAGAVTVNWGVFANNVVSFLIVAFVVFLLIRGMNRLKRQEESGETPAPTTRACPYCTSSIPIPATRCPQCTSRLEGPQSSEGP